MEAPLNAREFLKRFHLPQLVRLTGWEGGSDQEQAEVINEDNKLQQARPSASMRQLPNDDTSISSSFLAFTSPPAAPASTGKKLHEKSDWTYKPAQCHHQQEQRIRSVNSLGHLELIRRQQEDPSGFRSLLLPSSQNDGSIQHELDQPSSISAWSSVQVDRMLLSSKSRLRQEDDFRQVKMPRASLINQQQQQVVRTSGDRKSVEFVSGSKKSTEAPKRANEPTTACPLESIRLTPPSKRLTFSKLQLNQPFLLYKAYRKLELRAYVVDMKNEINEKSGDPIYFPANYPGWFSLCPQEASLRRHQTEGSPATMVHFAAPASGGGGPLATIEQVCQANAQIFLTRDEILAYQLPNKLSHMTKLKNNQLLALPLAINLETQSNAQRRSDRKRTGQQKRKGSPIGDIRQLVVGVGQVMKICGIYEDVLPLMSAEAAGTNQSNQFPLFNQQVTHPSQRQDKLDLAHRLHYASNGCPVKLSHDNLQARKQRKWQEQTYGRAYPTPPPLIYAGPDTSGGAPILRGQRYARCILLSSNSVDALTDCTSQQVPSAKGPTNQESAQQPEVEVLVPVNQRGRFYICADKQAVLNELRCRHNSCHAPNPSLVFRLNQIVSLLNLSKRLSLEGSRQGGPVKLPLTVSLVLGARPTNFSPSMFASSSLVQENRLESESNVAGHALACSYNRNNASPHQTSFAPCTCSRQSSNGTGSGGGGLFSAVIRIEQVARRDVLLACTIKQRPLTQLSRPADLESKLASRFRRELPAHNGTLTESASKTICSGKASFSRLKACRSLLSMNGRRKKQRPNIPSSMLTETDGWNLSLATGTQNGSYGSQQRALDLVVDPSRCQPAEEEEEEAEGQIVMIEFDCANEQLSFVRTFVESSLPTASIPDLVLNRMDFCHRNSLDWERQLKLSYASLSQNFELCRRQLGAAATNTLASSLVSWPPNQPGQPSSAGTISTSSPREDELTSTGSSRSTRSSSGVSSSEGRARDKPPEVAEAASSRHDQHSSRLLRLVHRMLPSKSSTEDTGNSPETIATLMNAQKIHRKLAQRRQSATSVAGNLLELQKGSSKTPTERDFPDQSECGSHLYESLERLNVRLDRQRRLANEVAAANRVAPGLVAARSDNCLPGPIQSLVGSDGSSGESSSFASLSKANAENASFSSNDDWWNATVSGEARQSELEEQEKTRRSIRARRNHHQLMFLDDETVGLEPVSIEACEGELGDADIEEPHLLSGGIGAYANLEEVERASEPTTSRMERKLLKIRRQRRLGPGKGFYKASESDGGGTFTRNALAEMELGTRADSVNSLASAFERWPGAAGSATNRSSSSSRKSPSLDSPSVSSFSSSTETNSSQTRSECSLSLASSSEFGRTEGRRRQLINWKPRIPFKASTGRPGLPVGQVTGGPAGSGVGQSGKLATLDRC